MKDTNRFIQQQIAVAEMQNQFIAELFEASNFMPFKVVGVLHDEIVIEFDEDLDEGDRLMTEYAIDAMFARAMGAPKEIVFAIAYGMQVFEG